ncbi:MAG: hypothetical protein LLG20_25290 [Acidobacteriales bacterium]|nr:hypothetical protein [Terriglobales bacterium]
MLKLGICEADQDTPLQRLWRRGLISASLLAMKVPASPVEVERFERLMPQICLSNGVARTTSRRRFAELDEAIEVCLREVLACEAELRVEDWAVSNGITAAEWFQRLRIDYPKIRFTASDTVLYLIEAHREQFGDTYILEPDGTPIQYVHPPFVISLVRRTHWVYWVNRRLHDRALDYWRSELGREFRHPAEWNTPVGAERDVQAPPFRLRRLPLIHPNALRLQSERFRIVEHSIFTPLSEQVDVVRTMNILNRAYFTEAELRRAASAVEHSLRPCGLWIVGRTVVEHPPQHEVSVLQKCQTGWRALLRIGNGSEMEQVIKSC